MCQRFEMLLTSARLTGMLGAVTGGFLALLGVPLSILIFLLSLAYWLFVMYKAYANERYEVPFIGPLAARQAG